MHVEGLAAAVGVHRHGTEAGDLVAHWLGQTVEFTERIKTHDHGRQPPLRVNVASWLLPRSRLLHHTRRPWRESPLAGLRPRETFFRERCGIWPRQRRVDGHVAALVPRRGSLLTLASGRAVCGAVAPVPPKSA